MLGIREEGLVIMAWSIVVLVFQDWVIHIDAAIRRLVSGALYRPPNPDAERHRLVLVARVLLGVGGVAFVGGAVLRGIGAA